MSQENGQYNTSALMHHWNWSEIYQFIGLNGVALAWSAHYQWWELIPQPEHLLEWLVGLLVGVSLLSVNAVKVYYLISDKRKEKAKERRRKPRIPRNKA
jgi:hypothetical protein